MDKRAYKNDDSLSRQHTAALAAPRKMVRSKARICSLAHTLASSSEPVLVTDRRPKSNNDSRDGNDDNYNDSHATTATTTTRMTRIPFADVLNDDFKEEKKDDLFKNSNVASINVQNDGHPSLRRQAALPMSHPCTLKRLAIPMSNKETFDAVSASRVAYDSTQSTVARKMSLTQPTTVHDVTAQSHKKESLSMPPPSSPPLEYKDMDMQKVARFVIPHRTHFQTALKEIAQGSKKSYYIWYLLPTPPYMVHGVERGSVMNRRFALRSDAQVMAYLRWDRAGVNLRQNYLDTLNAVLRQLRQGKTMRQLLGKDSVKAMSSIHLFMRVAHRIHDQHLKSLCQEVLQLAQDAK